MSTRVGPIELSGPVMVASGCGGTGRELAPYLDLHGVGYVTRTLTLDPRPGYAGARIVETPSGLVHATGLPNLGLQGFSSTELPPLNQTGAKVFVSIAGAQVAEYTELARRLGQVIGVAGLEVNVGQPDAGALGLHDVREPFHVASVVTAVRRELPPGVALVVKLWPDPSRVGDAAKAAVGAGADAVTVGNAVPALLPGGRRGGLSGPAIGPLALRCVAETLAAVPATPVLASGGIADTATARTFLDIGATAVQVGTALLHDPTTVTRIAAALADPSRGESR